MTTFTSAVKNQNTRTTNGMKTPKSSGTAVVDLFFKIGSMRGQDVTSIFSAAFAENKELALRIAQWVRDVRGGAGERQTFRNILKYLERTDIEAASLLMRKIPELGRFDDLLIVEDKQLKAQAFEMIAQALKTPDQSGLCAKWMPRKGEKAAELRRALGLTPKGYRKTLVSLTNVVETKMCAKQWDQIDFSKLPSLASARYRTAFHRNTENFKAYVEKLVKKDPTVKVNAGAVYPYDVLKSVIMRGWGTSSLSKTDRGFIISQWDALPNYVGDASILPLIDVSGSMNQPAGVGSSIRAIDVAVSIGLYLADKNKGAFNGTFLAFSSNPQLMHLKGDIIQKAEQMEKSNWDMSTDVIAAFQKILKVAMDGKVPQEEMPKTLLIVSDMQFNQCARYDDTAMQSVRRNYKAAGYDVPNVVFWTMNSMAKNVPVKHNEQGAALISGFSPSIVKAILEGAETFTPEAIMLQTIMNPRYDLV